MAKSDPKLIKSSYVCIDGVMIAVKPHYKYIFECQRGFLFGKERKPELVVLGKNTEWTPKKEVLHAPHEKFTTLWPVRISEGRDDWQTRVFETFECTYDPSKPFIDCTK